ncbi:MAG TPA: SRPBCC domain-containing protein [Candidatus Binataceae bacterium]
MTALSSAATELAERELVIERIFDAPRALVFKAWTEPERMAQWWGPRGFTMTSCKMDLRPGGAYRFEMRSPADTEHRTQGVFREIEEPERLVYTWAWVDAEGKSGHETLVTLTFAEHGGKTKLTLHQATFESVTARDAHRGGWTTALDCLAEYVATA